VGIFVELTGLFLSVKGLLKFEFVCFTLFRLVYFKFKNNPQDTTILFSFPVAFFPRVIILSVSMVDV
jgi:Cu/Ag efflux pump CusA